jgi:hypothetical protein
MACKSVFPESITNPSNGFNRIGIGTNFLAQRTDVDIDRAFEYQGVFAERRVDQFGAIECSAWLSDECIEQSKFALGKFDLLTVDTHTIASSIQSDPCTRDDIVLIIGFGCFASL